MITRRLVWVLGASQLTLWGVTYYLIAVFGEPIARETGWSRAAVYGGFSLGLVTMGFVSGTVGRLIDRYGGRVVMGAGSVLSACGCAGIALARDLATYYAAWLVLGLAMRMTLYDAAFASLARIGGPAARRPISQITLLGGLASTALWPIGEALIRGFGWRGALLIYAAIALATMPLHLLIPPDRYGGTAAGDAPRAAPLADTPRRRIWAGTLFALLATLTSFLNSGMSAHMIAIMTALGLSASVAVSTATLRGVGQSASRLGEILFGSRLDPFALGLLAASIVPFGFVVGLWSGALPAAAIGFALIYGAGNGLLTIVRGTQPLLLFDPASYGRVVGRLLGPSFFLSALGPTGYAWILDRWGPAAALNVSTAIGAVVLASAFALWLMFRRPAPAG